jgi:hypothetical protein
MCFTFHKQTLIEKNSADFDFLFSITITIAIEIVIRIDRSLVFLPEPVRDSGTDPFRKAHYISGKILTIIRDPADALQ